MEAYNVYFKAVDGVSFNGQPLKSFGELPIKIQNAWKEVKNEIEKRTIIETIQLQETYANITSIE